MTSKIRFLISVGLVIALTAICFYTPSNIIATSDNIRELLISNYGYIFTWSAAVLLLIEIAFICSPFGSIKLCRPEDADRPPRFSNFAYWAMILACGIGVAPIFWTVLEPVAHMQEGMSLTDNMVEVYHNWTIGAGSYYGMFGLALSYLIYNKRQNFAIQEFFKNNTVNTIINALLAVSIAIGLALTFMYVLEILIDGFNGLDLHFSIWQLVGFVTIFTLASSYADIDKGIKTVSYAVIIVTLSFIGYVYLQNYQYSLLTDWIVNWFNFVIQEPRLLIEVGDTPERKAWLAQWSFNYFASWLGWAIFLGMFVCKISYGRTIRSLLIGSLLVPSILATLWFTVFGESAIFNNINSTFDLVNNNFWCICIISALTVLFFVVQHDSAGIVLEDLTIKHSRLFWVILIAVLTLSMSLLSTNSVELLRNITTISSVPILVIVFVMMWRFLKTLYIDLVKKSTAAAVSKLN